ncbi:transposase [Paenibacillus sp. TRM 82003]|nr:transposase [Paenibacillus sp. TRM 82003]
MVRKSSIEVLFERRWPGGFACPRCGHRDYYEIATRQLPLYQCKLCRRQTTVTSGTVMDKTRTPLDRWIAAIDALSSSAGLNARRLAESISVSHKTAWTMLRKLREAIVEIEGTRKLRGVVHAGLRALAPKYIWMFIPDRRYRRERVVSLCGAIGTLGKVTALKLEAVEAEDLAEGTKQLTARGARRIGDRSVDSNDTRPVWLNRARMASSPLTRCFEEANRWMLECFNGVGTKHLQSYLSEFSFRWNVAAEGLSPQDAWYKLCFPASA